MASVLDRFKKNIVGSQNRITDYTSVISSSGDFSRINNVQAILNSWNNILLTQVRSYVANPEYGSNLYKFVFDPLDDDTIESIKDEIRYRLMLYDDRALLTNIDISYSMNGHGFVVDIDLEYKGETGFLSVSIDDRNILNFDA